METEKRPGANRSDLVRAEAENELLKELKFNDFKALKMPDFENYEADVRLNIAMLKREKHLIDKDEAATASLVKQMEMGLKDASEFDKWRGEMDQKDRIEQLEYV